MSSAHTPQSPITPRTHRRRFEIAGHVRFVTFSCQRRLQLLANDKIKDAFVEHLGATRERKRFRLHAFVVMPEHVHLLLSLGDGNAALDRVLGAIKGPFARKVLNRFKALDAPILHRLRTGGGERRFWLAGGGYDRNIYTMDEALEKVEYIHANPLRRGLVENPCEYRWSSAAYWLGRDDAVLRMDPIE